MRILVVEDDDDIAAVIEQTLEAIDYSVDRAATGPDGLWRAREGRYGAIVLDILLPEMNGYKVCSTLRSEGVTTPILMLTAKVGHLDETDGLDLGADDYLRKPFSPEVLQARVRALLRRVDRTTADATLERGTVTLDPATRTCTAEGRSVALSRRQAQLLEVLLRAGDVPQSRLQLLDAVWGIDYEGDPNVVDVYLGYLRAKLGRESIENLRGSGYRVRA